MSFPYTDIVTSSDNVWKLCEWIKIAPYHVAYSLSFIIHIYRGPQVVFTFWALETPMPGS